MYKIVTFDSAKELIPSMKLTLRCQIELKLYKSMIE